MATLSTADAKQRRLVVVTRDVSPSIAKCELTCIDREPISIERVREQERAYADVLAARAHELIHLPALEAFPDSMFVEDVAFVVRGNVVVLTRPGAPSRRGEVEHIAAPLRAVVAASGSRGCVVELTEPATADGGDILVAGPNYIFVGKSTRTNDAGFAQISAHMAAVFAGAVDVVQCEVRGHLHLKSVATAVDPATVLIDPACIDAAVFTSRGFHVIETDPTEQHSANVLSVLDPKSGVRTILVDERFPLLIEKLRSFKSAGGETVEVVALDADEIAKAEGALTCSSLLLYV